MRKFLTSILILTSVSSFSAILSPDEALQRVFADSEGPKHAASSGEITLIETFKSPKGSPAVYFFKEGVESWMAVSASDATEALLGYGDTYSPGIEMPPQMKWWLSQYSLQIAHADSIATYCPQEVATPQQDVNAGSPLKARPAPISPLMKTKWNQSEPYNLYSPEVNGVKTPTGCVATALSQVMKYHNYPPASKGSGSATAGGEEFFMDLDRQIHWDDMLDVYSSGDYSDTQAEAVADLMLLAGYGVKMQYAPGGSGAYNTDANRTLVENFSYAPSAWAYYRDHYPTAEWKDMLYQELSNGRPIYYSGYSSGGGHAFVCDGYNILGYFHFNWGWGGSYDGNFAIDALNPSGQGIGGFAGGYNNDQVAFLGVTPPSGDEKRPAVRLSSFDTTSCEISDTQVITLQGGWYNMSYVETEITVSLELTESKTGDSWQAEPFVEILPPNYGYEQLDFDLSTFKGADGEYSVHIVTKTADNPEWLPALTPYWEPKDIFVYKTGKDWRIIPTGEENNVGIASSETGPWNVFSPSGTFLRRIAQRSDISSFSPGIYILRRGADAIKVNVGK